MPTTAVVMLIKETSPQQYVPMTLPMTDKGATHQLNMRNNDYSYYS